VKNAEDRLVVLNRVARSAIEEARGTYPGVRFRASGEDRQHLSGHKGQRITTHCSEAELANLTAAAEKACEIKPRKTPAIYWATGTVGAPVETNSLI
jgi:hypothetical protein